MTGINYYFSFQNVWYHVWRMKRTWDFLNYLLYFYLEIKFSNTFENTAKSSLLILIWAMNTTLSGNSVRAAMIPWKCFIYSLQSNGPMVVERLRASVNINTMIAKKPLPRNRSISWGAFYSQANRLKHRLRHSNAIYYSHNKSIAWRWFLWS